MGFPYSFQQIQKKLIHSHITTVGAVIEKSVVMEGIVHTGRGVVKGGAAKRDDSSVCIMDFSPCKA